MTARADVRDHDHRPARALRRLVRRARLDAAAAPDRAARQGAGRALDAADRADRRRQDAGRLPAEPGRRCTNGRRTRRSAGAGSHTLYVSPLKALAVDIARNLERPVAEMGLPVTHRDAHRRHAGPQAPAPEAEAAGHPADDARADGAAALRHRRRPLLRRPRHGDPRRVAFAGGQQARRPAGARPRAAADAGARACKAIGLSATVAEPDALRAGWSGSVRCASRAEASARNGRHAALADLDHRRRAAPSRRSRSSTRRSGCPGRAIRRATRIADIYAAIARAQDGAALRQHPQPGRADLPGAVADQRRRPADRAASRLARRRPSAARSRRRWRRASSAPSSAPRRSTSASTGATSTSSSISARRRARAGSPSASAAPTTGSTSRRRRSWCRPTASRCWNAGRRSTPTISARRTRRRSAPAALDVLAQHVLGMACAAPFDAGDALSRGRLGLSLSRPRPRRPSTGSSISSRPAAMRCKTYERYAKIRQGPDGLWRITHPRVAQQYRLNVGTIIEAPMLNVRVSRAARAGFAGRGGRVLGKIEEYFIEQLSPGDTFLFAGQVLRFEGIRENEAIATRTADDTPKIPIYAGGKFPLTTYLADRRARACSPTRSAWKRAAGPGVGLAAHPEEALGPAEARPAAGRDLSARRNRFYLVAYPFEGRLAHQTLGMLLTRRLERARLQADRLRRHRLFARGLGARRPRRRLRRGRAEPRRALRRGHARRRPRCLDGGELPAQAHLPRTAR